MQRLDLNFRAVEIFNYMNYAVLKAAASIPFIPLCLDCGRIRLMRLLRYSCLRNIVIFFAVTRIVPAFLAFSILNLKLPSDISGYYMYYANTTLEGARDPNCPYSPGFDGFLAALLLIFNSPFSIVFMMIIFEIAAFAIFAFTLNRGLKNLENSLLFFWFVNPITFFHITLGGQDEAVALLSLTLVLWAVASDKYLVGGLYGAIGLLFSKILTVFGILPLCVLPDKKALIGIASFLITIGIAVLVFSRFEVPFLGFMSESSLVTSGNIWIFPDLICGPGHRLSNHFTLAVALLGLVGSILWIRTNPLHSTFSQALRIVGVSGSVFLLLSPKSLTAYSVMFLPGILYLMLTMNKKARTFLVTMFFPALAFEPSLWFYFSEGTALANCLWGRVLVLMVDLMLVAGYVLLIWHGIGLHRRIDLTSILISNVGTRNEDSTTS